MNEKQAKTVLHNLKIGIQKARSNMEEGLCGPRRPSPQEKKILRSLDPTLFPHPGKIDLLEGLNGVIGRVSIEPVEFYNFLYLACKSPAIVLTMSMGEQELPAITPLPSWLSGWDK